MEDAEKGLSLLKKLKESGDCFQLKAFKLFQEARYYVIQDDNRCNQLMDKVISFPFVKNSYLWTGFRISRLNFLIYTGYFKKARQQLEELQTVEFDSKLSSSFEFCAARFHAYYGNGHEAMEFLKKVPSRIIKKNKHGFNRIYFFALFYSENFQTLKKKLSEDVNVDPMLKLYLEAMIELENNQFKKVNSLIREFFQKMNNNSNINSAYSILLNMELQNRNVHKTKVLLKSLDPQSDKIYYDLVRARICLIEDDWDRAVIYFKNILKISDLENLLIRLRFADEITVTTLSKLYLLGKQLMIEEQKKSKHLSQAEDNQASRKNYKFIVKTKNALKVKYLIKKFADLNQPVLITGKTGTGKEITARLLHQTGSRSKEPFLVINCGAISDTLAEAELFGYVKGAFTGAAREQKGLFEITGKGTIFLDEVSSMSFHLQTILLRVLETNQIRRVGGTSLIPIKARVIAATSHFLEDLIKRKIFRKDLYYRLDRLRIDLPSLNQRKNDIPVLIDYFLKTELNIYDVTLEPEYIKLMMKRNWDGNVRELKNEIERHILISDDYTTPELSNNLNRDAKASDSEKLIFSQEPMTGISYTKDRLEMLRRYFKSKQELTRKETAILLKCSLKSATKYLHQLEKEKLISRIQTSSHLRTSFFKLNVKS